MNKKRYTRKVSFNERFFIVGNRLCPPLANQFIFDGEGEFNLKLWENAVEKASEANPGTRVILKGRLGSCRWVDTGITPAVKLIDRTKWSGYDPENAPFLISPLLPETGPTCEVVLVRGNPLRIIFRTLHAVMDGRGTLVWMEDIFRALRGERILGSDSVLTDTELAGAIQNKLRTPFPTEHIAPTGTAPADIKGMTWQRKRIKGRFKNLLPQLAILLAREAWRHSDGIVRFGIPVDLRAYRPDLRSTANLTFAIYIEVKPDSTVDEIRDAISIRLKDFPEGILSRYDDLSRYIPISLLCGQAQKIISRRMRNGIFSISGIISNVGKLDVKGFTGGGFKTTAFWCIPPCTEYVPYMMGITGHNDMIDIVSTVPRALATDGRLSDNLDRIAAGLAPEK